MSGTSGTMLVDPTTAQTWMGPTLDMSTFNQDLFNQAIVDASSAVIDILGWDPSVQTATEYYSGTGHDSLMVNRKPVTVVNTLSIRCGTNLQGVIINPATDILVDGSRKIIWFCGRFPIGTKNVIINYEAGFATIPSGLVRATLATLKAMWTAPYSDQNSTGESFAGILAQSWWPTGPGAVPPQAMSLLNPYMLHNEAV